MSTTQPLNNQESQLYARAFTNETFIYWLNAIKATNHNNACKMGFCHKLLQSGIEYGIVR